jgi:hypothetical protein
VALSAVAMAAILVLVPERLAAYTLAVTATHGTVTKDPDAADYVPGTVVTLLPRPSVAYSLASWSGDISTKQLATQITMNGNKAVTANFEAWRAPIGIPAPRLVAGEELPDQPRICAGRPVVACRSRPRISAH